MTHTFSAAASAFLRPLGRFFGRDVHIEPAGPAWAFLDFDRMTHGGKEHEAWGLGLHIVVSSRSAALRA